VKAFLVFLVPGLFVAQAQVKPVVRQQGLNEQVNVVRLAPRYATAIRMPEAVSSVIVGDPAQFLAEHSDKEPTLVLVKPVVEEPAESNLLVTTVRGRQISFVLRSDARGSPPVDFLLIYKPARSFLVEESDLGSSEVPGTEKLHRIAPEPEVSSVQPTVFKSEEPGSQADSGGLDLLDQLLERQQRAPLPPLYGMRAPAQERKGEPVRVGVSEVVDQGRTVVVLFSVVNPQRQAIEILPPQIQLAGKIRKGFIIRRSRWGTSEQLPVSDFRLTRRRLGAGERADGVVVFTRPNFKQSNESVFLQVAESGAVDRPALAPIGFGISALRKESRHGQ
jgi:hypothetical protein